MSAAKEEKRRLKALRSQAVREAWEREAALVKQGRATRNWTLAEQEELLRTGRIKGYYGHHVKSVSKYPELAGDQANIQFLTRSEHFHVHLYNWKYSVGHYYDVENNKVVSGIFNPMFREIKLKEKYDMNYSEKYAKLYESHKASILDLINGNPEYDHNDLVRLYAMKNSKIMNNPDHKRYATCMFFELKNAPQESRSDSPLLDAYCSGYATSRFNSEGLGESRSMTGAGRVGYSDEYQRFLAERKADSIEKAKKCQQVAQSTNSKTKSEAYTHAIELYKEQYNTWDNGAESAQTKTNSISR